MKYPMPAGAVEIKKHQRADGRSISYADNGVASDKALLLHHGTPGAAGLWQTVLDDAAKLGVRAIAYTKAGYPGSDRAEWASVAEAATDFLELIDDLGVTQFVSIGWSGGGPFALASTFSPKCVGAELVAGVAPYADMGADFLIGLAEHETIETLDSSARSREDSLRMAIDEMKDIESQWTAENWQAGSEARPDYARFKEEYATFNAHALPVLLNAVVPDLTGYADDNYLILADWGFAVHDVSKPVSIWNGTLDKAVPPGHAHWLQERIAGSTVHILEGQSHMSIMIETQAEILASAIAKLNS
jgi:pimeloyl-ACP methyl ester carboxylesterase